MPYAPRATFDNPYGPQVTFRTLDILPPPAYYVSPDDKVVMWILTDVPSLTLVLQIRLLTPQGEVKLMPYQFSATQVNSWYPAFQVNPVEGYILGALCWALDPARGRCFAIVVVMRGGVGGFMNSGEVLVQGYINALNTLSYPTSPLEPTFNGRGAFLNIEGAGVTGTELVITAPTLTLWKFYCTNFVLNTSANPGNRVVSMAIMDNGGNAMGFWTANFAHAPSTLLRYSFSSGAADMNQGGMVQIGGPSELFIPAGWSLQTSIQGLQSNDSMSGPMTMVEEWMGE